MLELLIADLRSMERSLTGRSPAQPSPVPDSLAEKRRLGFGERQGDEVGQHALEMLLVKISSQSRHSERTVRANRSATRWMNPQGSWLALLPLTELNKFQRVKFGPEVRSGRGRRRPIGVLRSGGSTC
jgi:hypothetical protein